MLKLVRGIVACLAASAVGNVQAALVDRGGGLIYDTELNVTWLQDANYAKTSGFDADGRMLWPTALTWADSLQYVDLARNVVWTDWRLPRVRPSNGISFNYTFSVFGNTDVGMNILSPNAEMSYMFYENLDNPGRFTADGVGPVSSGVVNSGPFFNLSGHDIYWYETPFPISGAFNFYMDFGNQGASGNIAEHEFFAWAVRDGDVGPAPSTIPEPTSIALAAFGIIGLTASRRRIVSIEKLRIAAVVAGAN